VEIHCVCDPQLAAQRFLNRSRHPGHLDREKGIEDLLSAFQELAALGPLGIGRLLQVDTTTEVDLDLVVSQVKAIFSTIDSA